MASIAAGWQDMGAATGMLTVGYRSQLVESVRLARGVDDIDLFRRRVLSNKFWLRRISCPEPLFRKIKGHTLRWPWTSETVLRDTLSGKECCQACVRERRWLLMPRHHGLFQNYIESTSPFLLTLRTTQNPRGPRKQYHTEQREVYGSDGVNRIAVVRLAPLLWDRRFITGTFHFIYGRGIRVILVHLTLKWRSCGWADFFREVKGWTRAHSDSPRPRSDWRQTGAGTPRRRPPFFPTSSLSSVPGTASEEPTGPSTSWVCHQRSYANSPVFWREALALPGTASPQTSVPSATVCPARVFVNPPDYP